MGLIDAINRDPGEEAANDQAPEGVSPSEVRVEVEELHPPAVVVPVPDLLGPAHVVVPLDDDGQEAAEHAGGLEHVCPHDGLDATDGGVENADSKDHKTGNIEIESGDLNITLLLSIVFNTGMQQVH